MSVPMENSNIMYIYLLFLNILITMWVFFRIWGCLTKIKIKTMKINFNKCNNLFRTMEKTLFYVLLVKLPFRPIHVRKG